MTRSRFPALGLAASAAMTLCSPLPASAVEPAALLALSAKSPAPPWPAGDELGHGQHPRRGDDVALRLAPVAAGRAHLRSVVRSFEHDAEVAVRQPVAEQAQADRRRAVLRPRLQQRGLRRRRRAAAARHADRRARPLRVDRVAVGSQEPVRRRRRVLLRGLQAARRQAERPIRRCSSSASRRSRRWSRRRCCSTREAWSARAGRWATASSSPPPTSTPC